MVLYQYSACFVLQIYDYASNKESYQLKVITLLVLM